ncbi:IS21 family transposase [Acidithiobacillus thiooxidans]|uniref:Transposase n=2 Tax=Acidithiobacillus TaxID=119977 RepID=A0A543PZV3_ACITH|nr:IS21 family transposase [Acidithiobacillus thiooxidans]MDX5934101.1 IS21 family transposase [Acidithiobacillus thiooxidans]MDX5936390.1 IS21 family transposase [Acidithiobacillus thiooxidans]TQN49602.1 Transposase [Acidithiobacillus thiooxidans ATCC 19377]TQN51679.1 Transposase [Acidithiobacillus thiooxidans ATCC 19377]
METIAKVRRLYHLDKETVSHISRKMNLSRATVRKYLDHVGDEPKYPQRKSRPRPQLGAFEAILQQWLETDAHLPRKQKRTARRLFEGLQKAGYQGAYDSIQRWVKAWKANVRPGLHQAFIPLSFRPGEAYQFDWSSETVILDGVAMAIKVAHFRLTYSRMSFVRAYPRETQEMVFAAHQEAFLAFEGVPERGIYDNPKTIVDVVYNRSRKGQERDFNRRFLALMNHYLIRPTACTVAAGWEKGQVENQVGNIREWFFTPLPRFETLDQLNAWLWERCQERAQNHAHPEQKTRTIWAVFQEEKALLRPFQATFDGYVEDRVRVKSTCLISVDRNHYSVPAEWAGEWVRARRYVDRIVVLMESAVIATHARRMGRDKTITDPQHYLQVLERKPGALRNGLPFQKLPRAITLVQEHLQAKAGGDKAFVEVLLAARDHGMGILETACAMALEQKTVTVTVILNLVHRLAHPLPPPPQQTPEALHLKEEPTADCSRYDTLRGKPYVH